MAYEISSFIRRQIDLLRLSIEVQDPAGDLGKMSSVMVRHTPSGNPTNAIPIADNLTGAANANQ